MDNISKISAEYSLELKDSHTVRLLICYLLKKLDRPVTPDQLYEIAVGNDIINYFFYTEAIQELIKNKTVLLENQDGNEYYFLTDKGRLSIEDFKQYIPKSFRDKLLSCALRYFAQLKRESEVKCELEETSAGCYVRCRILDISCDLLDMKIFAPDAEQAEFIRKKIMLNPADFYGKIMGFALLNEEDEIILDE